MKKTAKTLSLVIAAAIIIAGAYYLFSSGRGKITGSYVYIERGYLYIKRGEFEKGLAIMKKALEASSRDKSIRKEFISAGLAYVDDLVSRGNLDKALEIANNIYAIGSDDKDAVHALAYLYCERAVRKAKEKKYGAAITDYQAAVKTVSEVSSAAASISNHLFNSAVDAYNSKDDGTALLSAKASYDIWHRSDTLSLLAQIYYRRSDLFAARFFWLRAKKMKTEPGDLDSRLEMVEKDIRARRGMRSVPAANFNIKLYGAYTADIDELGRMLKKIYTDVGGDLKYYPSSSTPVVFYSEEEFRDIFKQGRTVQAFFDGSIRLPVTAVSGGLKLFVVIAHEYTHAVVSIITDNKCPVWLNEGIAGYEQSRYYPVPVDAVARCVNDGNRLSVKTLESGFALQDDDPGLLLSYEGAYTVVCFILDKWGLSGLNGLLSRIKAGRHYVNAIDEEFLIPLGEFEDMWNGYLHKIKLTSAR